jgi:phage-related protein
MARTPSTGEKPLDRVGSSKRDFLDFPERVKDEMGNALALAQFGGKHPSAKPWKGQGPGVFDLVERRLKIARQDYEVRHGKATR